MPVAAPRQQQTAAVPQRQPPSASSSAGMEDRQAMEKKQKEKFIVFTRVLMKYLEQKDKGLHTKVKEIIKDCADRNKKKERGFESVTQSMRKRLKEVVPDNYWKRAEAYMLHLVNKQKQHGSDPNRRSGAASSSMNRPGTMPMQQRGMPTSSSGAVKPQVPTPQQSQQQQRPQQGQVLNSIRDDIKKTQPQHRQAPKTAAPPFQSSQTKKPGASPSSAASTKGRSGPKATRRSSEATDTSQAASREYSELLPMVDHAMNYDWKTAGSLLGGTKTQAMLTEEQSKLLNDYRVVVPQLPPDQEESYFPREGWGRRNVVSTRVAFARLRCSRTNPTPTAAWTNEDVAEDDPALAVLSEGAQQYLKGILKNALHSARSRQNFDGTRIWYQQRMAARSSSGEKPEFGIRLGCDVNRQLALSQANAAMTSKRMEEALSRRKHQPTEIKDETLDAATSMSDLATMPKVESAVATLESVGKRNLDIYGGKDSAEPPFGRVAKTPRLEVADFVAGMQFSRRRGGQRASSIQSTFTY